MENIVIKKLLRKYIEIIFFIFKFYFKDGGGVFFGEEDDV